MDTRPNIIFSPPDITEEEVREVSRVLLSGWITTGPETKELERRMAEFCGVNRLACLSSATAGMEMTYRLLGIGEGDEVITTAYTYTATASAICHVGARPVLVDMAGDKGTISPYEPDYDAIAAAITPRTRAIIAVDVAGVMCDYDRLREIAESFRSDYIPSDNRYQKAIGRILVLADSAHGLGAGRGAYKSGQAADFTSFSFHAVKNLTTAEGGAVTWRPIPGIDDEEIYRDYMIYSLHGQSKDALAKEGSGGWEYDILFPGYKCNMTDIQAAVGMIQLKRYPDLLARRRELIARYDEGLKRINTKLGTEWLTALTHFTEESTSSGHLYLMRVGDLSHEERSDMIVRLAERGVPTNVHYKPLPLLTAYKDMGYSMEDYPKAYDWYRNEITLPLHTRLSDSDVDYVLQVLEEILEDGQHRLH